VLLGYSGTVRVEEVAATVLDIESPAGPDELGGFGCPQEVPVGRRVAGRVMKQRHLGHEVNERDDAAHELEEVLLHRKGGVRDEPGAFAIEDVRRREDVHEPRPQRATVSCVGLGGAPANGQSSVLMLLCRCKTYENGGVELGWDLKRLDPVSQAEQ